MLTVLLTCLPCAPAPLPRPPAPPKKAAHPLVGGWRVTWCGAEYHYLFRADGSLESRRAGTAGRYVGAWRQDGLTLHVEEVWVDVAGGVGKRYAWYAVLPGRPQAAWEGDARRQEDGQLLADLTFTRGR